MARLKYERWVRSRPWFELINNCFINQKSKPMEFHKNDDESMAEFRDAYEYATRKRPRHCMNKIELFKSFWHQNVSPFELQLTDEQIQSWIDNEKTIADAVYKSAQWQFNQPNY